MNDNLFSSTQSVLVPAQKQVAVLTLFKQLPIARQVSIGTQRFETEFLSLTSPSVGETELKISEASLRSCFGRVEPRCFHEIGQKIQSAPLFPSQFFWLLLQQRDGEEGVLNSFPHAPWNMCVMTGWTGEPLVIIGARTQEGWVISATPPDWLCNHTLVHEKIIHL